MNPLWSYFSISLLLLGYILVQSKEYSIPYHKILLLLESILLFCSWSKQSQRSTWKYAEWLVTLWPAPRNQSGNELFNLENRSSTQWQFAERMHWTEFLICRSYIINFIYWARDVENEVKVTSHLQEHKKLFFLLFDKILLSQSFYHF